MISNTDTGRGGRSTLWRWGYLVLAALLLLSCGDARRFRTEGDAVAHFEQQRPGFERAARLFAQLGVDTFEPPAQDRKTTQAEPSTEMSRLCRQLFISRIDIVPRKRRPEQQYIQVELAGHRSAPYGVIFVPVDHSEAMSALQSDVGAPPRVYRTVKELPGRWFYYEYQ